MSKPVQISIDEELLRTVDRDPETKRRGRSAVVASALRMYLESKRRRDVDQALLLAYGGVAADVAAEIGPFIEAQAWPKK
jgi:metal-responsive CopG/Arc/MetJ family transcriptional regulator